MRLNRSVAGVLCAGLVALPSVAAAQSYQCSLPGRLALQPPPTIDGPVRRVPVGGYTLAASWSPEYCHGARAESGSFQCSGRSGQFGFVLHGLWPEAAYGAPPQWCSLTPRPRPDDLKANLCMTPSPSLLEHEWAKHGSCMAKTPLEYFATARRLWQRLSWPDVDKLSLRKDITVGELRRAFLAANPGWSAGGISVQLSQGGWLREVQLCYGRDQRPAACRRDRSGARDAQALKVWRGL